MGQRLGKGTADPQSVKSPPRQDQQKASAAPRTGAGGGGQRSRTPSPDTRGTGKPSSTPASGGAARSSLDQIRDDDPKLELSSADFELISVLGKGAFGKVQLVMKKDDRKKKMYAMKTLSKKKLLEYGQIRNTATERDVLEKIKSPFLITLVYAWQTSEKLYMVLTYAPGGELFTWIRSQKRFNESRTRLYAAELILALEAMHKENIMHRDIKTENVLLDAEGHVKLTDFGLAKAGITAAVGGEGGTSTVCGTVDTMAPEVAGGLRYGKAADWWSLGALIYELLFGLPPFYSDKKSQMSQLKYMSRIQNQPLAFRTIVPDASGNAKDILTKLLNKDQLARLGSNRGVEEIKRHAFFSSLDFSRVLSREYIPEFRPPSGSSPQENFDPEFTREVPADSICQPLGDTMAQQAAFEDFTYRESPRNGESGRDSLLLGKFPPR